CQLPAAGQRLHPSTFIFPSCLLSSPHLDIPPPPLDNPDPMDEAVMRLIWAVAALAAGGFVLAWVGTAIMKRLTPRIGFVDKPGHRKIHDNPKPLGGGVAIFAAIALPMLAVLVAGRIVDFPADHPLAPYLGGLRDSSALGIAILLAMSTMHLMGLIDDRRALGPYAKLIIQFGTTAALVGATDLRILTAAGAIPSAILTVLWIVAITNAFNFLDNMDGLSAGVAAVCTL